ncbi:MAG: class I SAM-dependent methyltransferase [Sphingobacteriaceae bacterium]|nr:MAG: class I SAM-dependent methyltransferase [Sphingobacteriaceae bacterium]
MPNNYDAVAWFYDGLSRLVFGDALIQAQRFLVEKIPTAATVLIAGGGTGWILTEIARLHPAGLKIVYVEISAKMLRLSMKKNCGTNQVEFVHAAIEDYELKQPFDVVLTPFLFDNFSEKRHQLVFGKLHKSLKVSGLWLISDFQVEKKSFKSLWQKAILQTMYLFFGWLCKVETRKLIDIGINFKAQNYNQLAAKTFYRSFIISQVYQKTV